MQTVKKNDQLVTEQQEEEAANGSPLSRRRIGVSIKSIIYTPTFLISPSFHPPGQSRQDLRGESRAGDGEEKWKREKKGWAPFHGSNAWRPIFGFSVLHIAFWQISELCAHILSGWFQSLPPPQLPPQGKSPSARSPIKVTVAGDGEEAGQARRRGGREDEGEEWKGGKRGSRSRSWVF